MKKAVVNKVLGESEAVKWYLPLRLNFHKANEPSLLTDPSVVFWTEVFTSVNVENINTMFAAAYNKLVQQIDNCQNQFIDVDRFR